MATRGLPSSTSAPLARETTAYLEVCAGAPASETLTLVWSGWGWSLDPCLLCCREALANGLGTEVAGVSHLG